MRRERSFLFKATVTIAVPLARRVRPISNGETPPGLPLACSLRFGILTAHDVCRRIHSRSRSHIHMHTCGYPTGNPHSFRRDVLRRCAHSTHTPYITGYASGLRCSQPVYQKQSHCFSPSHDSFAAPATRLTTGPELRHEGSSRTTACYRYHTHQG